jgi:hypothetical protein
LVINNELDRIVERRRVSQWESLLREVDCLACLRGQLLAREKFCWCKIGLTPGHEQLRVSLSRQQLAMLGEKITLKPSQV